MHLHIDRSFTDERFRMCNLLMRFEEWMNAILKFIFFRKTEPNKLQIIFSMPISLHIMLFSNHMLFNAA